jgi:hypothetical protein
MPNHLDKANSATLQATHFQTLLKKKKKKKKKKVNENAQKKSEQFPISHDQLLL